MKKVCILNHGLASGGTDSFVLALAKGLIADGYDVTIAMAVDPDSAPQFRESEAVAMGAKIYKTSDLDGMKKKLRHCRRLYLFLKDGKFDVFHANMDLFNGLNMPVAWLTGVPVRVCHSHNSSSQYELNTRKHLVVSIYRTIMRRSLWLFSNRRCGCSEMAMDYLFVDKWKKDGNSTVIINGVDFAKYSSVGFDREQKKKELGLPQGKLLITVGRLADQKNPFFTIDVMEELRKRRPGLKLLWIGDGELRSLIEQKISGTGTAENVLLLGVRKNVNDYLRCADLFLMSSLFEGLPIAPVEAQAANLPCVLSDKITRQVDFGLCRFLSVDDGAAAWGAEICGLLDGKIRLAIDEEKRARFDQSYMVKSIERVYESGILAAPGLQDSPKIKD